LAFQSRDGDLLAMGSYATERLSGFVDLVRRSRSLNCLYQLGRLLRFAHPEVVEHQSEEANHGSEEQY
jgi:hypothetical protein